MLNVAVIGCGGRMSGLVKKMTDTGEARISAVADPRAEELRAQKRPYLAETRFYTTAEEMLAAETPDGITVGTRCSLHTKYALLAARKDVPIFLEKPVSTTREDLERLRTLLPMSDRVVVSFPLRTGAMAKLAKEKLPLIGKLSHAEAWNHVPYARGYYHKWYRDVEETQGLFLQKATHDLDYVTDVMGETPTEVCAMSSRMIYKGDHPAWLRCEDCAEKKTCPESPENLEKLKDGYALGPWCCFAEDSLHMDSGSVLVRYESGLHLAYSQDFVARKSAGARGARFFGYDGTLEMEFSTGEVRFHDHKEPRTIVWHGDTAGTHFGGDGELVANFLGVCAGRERSRSTLEDGIRSAAMCLAAKRSDENHTFEKVYW